MTHIQICMPCKLSVSNLYSYNIGFLMSFDNKPIICENMDTRASSVVVRICHVTIAYMTVYNKTAYII